jgi:hypothetical protein
MSKKMNYLIIIPIFGTIIILFTLYVKALKSKVRFKILAKLWFAIGFFGGFAILLSILLLKFINLIISIESFVETYGMLFAFILGGYLMNVFTIKMINRYYDKLVIKEE